MRFRLLLTHVHTHITPAVSQCTCVVYYKTTLVIRVHAMCTMHKYSIVYSVSVCFHSRAHTSINKSQHMTFHQARNTKLTVPHLTVFFIFHLFIFLHEPQALTMHYIRDECGDKALTLCRPMGLGFPAVSARQEGKDTRYGKQ